MIIELPISTTFKDRVNELPTLKVDRTEDGGVRRVVYEQASMPARYNSDIDLSTNELTRPAVEFATGASWGALAASYAAMSEPQTVVEEAKPILPQNLPTDHMEKIKAIVAQLHREVRYTGVEFGAGTLDTPERPCGRNWPPLWRLQRQGNSAGGDAACSRDPGEPCAARYRSGGAIWKPNMPGMNQFDHAIVYVPAAISRPGPVTSSARFAGIPAARSMATSKSCLVLAIAQSGGQLRPQGVQASSVPLQIPLPCCRTSRCSCATIALIFSMRSEGKFCGRIGFASSTTVCGSDIAA